MTSQYELCICTDSALHIHEAQNTRTTQVDARTIDYMSCFGKRATVKCKGLFDVPVFIDNSNFMTLLVVMFQDLILAFKKGVKLVFDEQQNSCQKWRKTANALDGIHFAKSLSDRQPGRGREYLHL